MNRLVILLLTLSLLPVHSVQAQLTNKPDRIITENGELVIHPILHGSIVLQWNGVNIFIDPYGGAVRYMDKGRPDLVLITHPHDDHLNLETLAGLDTGNATFIVPRSVAEEMPGEYASQIRVIANGEGINTNGLRITALPMYNLPEQDARHARGWGNAYLIHLGGRDIYVSGDTEDIPEMRALTGIDIAFVCMNLPYTMDINQAASAVLDFQPAIIYPYHHRGQDIHAFKTLVDAGNSGIDVRLKDWYAGGE